MVFDKANDLRSAEANASSEWIGTGHRILLLGRYVCLAKSPDCANCPINELCPSADAAPLGPWEDRAAHTDALVARRGA